MPEWYSYSTLSQVATRTQVAAKLRSGKYWFISWVAWVSTLPSEYCWYEMVPFLLTSTSIQRGAMMSSLPLMGNFWATYSDEGWLNVRYPLLLTWVIKDISHYQSFFSFTICINKTELNSYVSLAVCAAKEHKRSPQVDKSGVFILNRNINSVSCHWAEWIEYHRRCKTSSSTDDNMFFHFTQFYMF